MQNWWSNYAKMKARCAVDYEFKIFFRKANNCLLPNAELNLLPTFGKYRFHSTRRAKTPSKRAEIDLRLSFLPREAFIFGSSTKTEPFHDKYRCHVHARCLPPDESSMDNVCNTSLPIGWFQVKSWNIWRVNMLSFTKNRDQPQNRQVCLTTPCSEAWVHYWSNAYQKCIGLL